MYILVMLEDISYGKRLLWPKTAESKKNRKRNRQIILKSCWFNQSISIGVWNSLNQAIITLFLLKEFTIDRVHSWLHFPDIFSPFTGVGVPRYLRRKGFSTFTILVYSWGRSSGLRFSQAEFQWRSLLSHMIGNAWEWPC